MQEAVDAAEVHERTVVGDVLDHAVDDLTLFEVLHSSWRCSARVSSSTVRRRRRCCRGGDPFSDLERAD